MPRKTKAQLEAEKENELLLQQQEDDTTSNEESEIAPLKDLSEDIVISEDDSPAPAQEPPPAESDNKGEDIAFEPNREDSPDTAEDSPPSPAPSGTKDAKRPIRGRNRTAPKDDEEDRILSQRRSEFYHLDFKELDRDLSPEQLQEWQSIYASYRSQSILSGEVTGVDTNTFRVKNPETGELEERTVRSLVIIGYRVKIMIPETELWFPGEERPDYVTRSLVGAKVEYVILAVDRTGDCAVGSRKLALQKQRRRFRSLYEERAGTHVPCQVLTVGPKRCLVECGGFDLTLSQRDLSYTAIADLRSKYHPGQELDAVFKGFSPDDRPIVSPKEVNPNPFDGAETRHPVGCRRQAAISGKYAGGIFCTMKDGVTCLCFYSNNHFDTQFAIGDTVLIHITHYDNERKLIYARILSKW